jgi:hypothetical protein
MFLSDTDVLGVADIVAPTSAAYILFVPTA